MARTAKTTVAATVAATPAPVATMPAAAPLARAYNRVAAKYGAKARTVPGAQAAYTLTPLGAATARTGLGNNGTATVMALVAVATAKAVARNGGQPATTHSIVAAMLAVYSAGKGGAWAGLKVGKYAPGGLLPCHAWCAGYVRGAAGKAAGLLAQA
jgi:hypothetical protein